MLLFWSANLLNYFIASNRFLVNLLHKTSLPSANNEWTLKEESECRSLPRCKKLHSLANQNCTNTMSQMETHKKIFKGFSDELPFDFIHFQW